MIGTVDEHRRALLTIGIAGDDNAAPTDVEVWIDTAFDGHLVFRRELIEALGLESLVETEAILADGSTVTLSTYLAFVDWFGEKVPAQVVKNDGRIPLLGTELLKDCELRIDYREQIVEIS